MGEGGRVPASAQYEVRILGRPGPRILAALPGFEVVSCVEGHTRLRGLVQDQSALQGVLRALGDLGVEIEGLERVTGPG